MWKYTCPYQSRSWILTSQMKPGVMLERLFLAKAYNTLSYYYCYCYMSTLFTYTIWHKVPGCKISDELLLEEPFQEEPYRRQEEERDGRTWPTHGTNAYKFKLITVMVADEYGRLLMSMDKVCVCSLYKFSVYLNYINVQHRTSCGMGV